LPAASSATRAFRTLLICGMSCVALVVATLAAAGESLRVGAAGTRTESLGRLTVSVPGANLAAVFLLALAALGAAALVRVAAGALRVGRRQRRLVRALPLRGALPGHPDVRVVADPRPRAFCAGLLRPAVYITTGALTRLGPAQLEAVLWHEATHRLRRDPLRLAAAHVLSGALPWLGRLAERHALAAELAADEAAELRADRRGLAGAMVAFGGDPAPERVDRLLGRAPEWRLPLALSGASAAAALALGLLVWQLARRAVLHTTLNLPLLSHQPCVVLLAATPAALLIALRALARPEGVAEHPARDVVAEPDARRVVDPRVHARVDPAQAGLPHGG
jgi:Zn-dependent protease with chaperone function